jgi:hypothetical protein
MAKDSRSIRSSTPGRRKSARHESEKIAVIVGYAMRSIGAIRPVQPSKHHSATIAQMPLSKSSFSRRNLNVCRMVSGIAGASTARGACFMARSKCCGTGCIYCSTRSDPAAKAASQWFIVYKTAPPARGTDGAAKR